jgi:hypothetical protein
MKRYLIVLAVSMFAVACGDDSDDDDHNHDESAIDASTGDEDAGGGFADVTCNPAGSGACQNSNDCKVIEGGTARMAASDCGIACIGESGAEAQATCAEECLVEETSLTAGCAECYVAIVACSSEHCLGECLPAPNSKECFDCQVANDCRSAFDDCSGLPPAEAP